MYCKMKNLITFSLLLASVYSFSQQAWTREKGKYFALAGVSYYGYNSMIIKDLDDFKPLDRSVSETSLYLYGEYGIIEGLTATVQLPVKFSSSTDATNTAIPTGSLAALSNINIALTGRIWHKGGAVVSGKLRAGLPTASYDDITGLRSGFDATTIAPSLLAGIGTKHFFTSLEFGREFRNNLHNDRHAFGAQIGKWFANKKFIAIINVEGFVTIGDPSKYDNKLSETTGLFLADQSYVAPNLKLGYFFNPNTSLWLTAGGGLAGTNQIGASPGFSLGFSKSN
jgi:hypothetical protein